MRRHLMRRPRPSGRNERVQIQTAPTYPLPDGQTADLPLRWRRQFSTLRSEQYSAAFHRYVSLVVGRTGSRLIPDPRCAALLQPYAHPSLDPLLYPDLACELHPARQHPVPIRYLFPSAASALAAGEASPGKDRASTVLPPALRFPRRGAWIVPLCGALPIPHTSPAVWLSSPLDRARTPIPGGDSSSSGPPPIEWTDARLAALWTLLSTLHTKRSFGYIRAQAITSPAPFPPSPPSEEPPLGEPAEPVGDVIKINCDAHLALAFKGLLEQFTVAAARAVPARFRIGVGGPPAPLDKSAVESDGADGGGRAGRGARATMKGKGPQGTSAAADAAEVDDPARDREKWLKGRALVWLDEEGRAVLTA